MYIPMRTSPRRRLVLRQGPTAQTTLAPTRITLRLHSVLLVVRYLCASVLRSKHTTAMLEAPPLTEDDLNGKSQRFFESIRFDGRHVADS